jgi:hypothetical protein
LIVQRAEVGDDKRGPGRAGVSEERGRDLFDDISGLPQRPASLMDGSRAMRAASSLAEWRHRSDMATLPNRSRLSLGVFAPAALRSLNQRHGAGSHKPNIESAPRPGSYWHDNRRDGLEHAPGRQASNGR